MTELYVDVRLKVPAPIYRALYVEAERRRLAGAGELVELMLEHRMGTLPRRPVGHPTEEARPIPRDAVPKLLARIDAGEISVSAAARELGVTRGAIQHHMRQARRREAEEYAAHAAALDALGVVGRPPERVPAVPTIDA